MKILSITAAALLGSLVLVHPLWYMPWLRFTPQIKQMLEAAGWTCDKLDSTLDSPPPSAFEIVAPAESPTANILYDWARSAGYRPHFVMKERKLAILTGSDFYFQREQSD